MNFLSVSGDCYLVVGMDQAWIKTSIKNHFSDMVKEKKNEGTSPQREKFFADHYLEKMINIPAPIATLSSSNAMDLLLPQSNNMLPLSYFQKILQSISVIVKRFYAIFSLVRCTVMVYYLIIIIPENLFSNIVAGNQKAKNDSVSLALKESSASKPLDKKAAAVTAENTDRDINSQNEGNKNTKGELIPGSPDTMVYDYRLPLGTLLFFIFGVMAYSLKIPNRFVEDP
ncbi:MAG: hypothetical protein ACJAUP_000752 [Cellvibrionaceae bacterium]|jgi:hypothetical protein